MSSSEYGLQGTEGKITLSLECNNACVFCYNRERKQHNERLSEEHALALVEDAAVRGCTSLNLIGGEVTILPHFPKVLAAAGARFAAVSINTNGRRFADADFARACVDAGLSMVDVSLHGSTAIVHDGVSQAAGAFAQTTQGLRNLLTYGERLKVSVSTLVLGSNVHDLPALGALLVDLGVPSWRIKWSYGALGEGADAADAGYIPTYTEAMPLVRRALAETAGRINARVQDVPFCLLGELFEQSADFERHDVSVYSTRGERAQVRVTGRWGDQSARCEACVLREGCCRLSPAYVSRHGDAELRPFDAGAVELARARSRSFVEAMESRARGEGRACRDEGAVADVPKEARSPVDALFAELDVAARRGDWIEVQRRAVEILGLSPEHPEATRMRLRAERRILEARASACTAKGDGAGARRARAILARYYTDVD